MPKFGEFRRWSYHYRCEGQCWAWQGHQHGSRRSSAPCQSACCSSSPTLSKSSVELLMLLNPACRETEALTDAIWPDVAVGINDEANASNCLFVIPRPDPNLAATSSPCSLSLTLSFARAAPIAGQLAHIQKHQNIVRTTLCALALLSKLTFKSKMESSPPLLPPHLVLWVN